MLGLNSLLLTRSSEIVLQDAWKAHAIVVVRIDRIFVEKRPCDRVDEDWSSLVEKQLAINSCKSNSIRCVKINVHHACHVNIELLRQ